MSLENVFAAARQSSNNINAVRTAFGSMRGALVAGGVSNHGISSSAGGSGNAMAQAEEQLSHLRGYTHSVVRVIATRGASQPLRVAVQEDSTIVDPLPRMSASYVKNFVPESFRESARNSHILEKHRIYDLFEYPNPLMTRSAILRCCFETMKATGRCNIWMRTRDETESGLDEIWPIPPNWSEPVHTEEKLFASWNLHIPGVPEPVKVSADRMSYCYYIDPKNPFSSFSQLQANANAILADEYLEESQKASFRNAVNPSVALMVGAMPGTQGIDADKPMTLTTDQRNGLISAVMSQWGGVINDGKPMVLDGFIKDIKRLAPSNREMDYLNSGKSTQARVAQGFGVNPISMGEIEGSNRACTDVHSELLTRRGWLRYDEIREDDIAGTVNPKTHKLEWQRIEKIHIYPNYDGEMIRLQGQKVDALFTPDHRMWKTRHIQTQAYEGYRPTRRDLGWGFVPASQLKCHDALLLAPNRFVGERQDWFTVPAVSSACGAVVSEELRIPMSAFLAYLGWFVSEGWTVTKSSNTIGIRQAVGGVRECAEIDACTQAVGVKVNRYLRKGKTAEETEDGYARQPSYTWVMKNKSLWSWLRENCGVDSASKKLPEFVFDLPGDQLNILLDALLLGDGCHPKPTAYKNISGKLATYFSISETLIDQVQTLAMMCGRASRRGKRMKNGIYPVAVSTYNTRMSLLPKHISREQYKGTVWCVTVPNGLIITRRNGKPIVSGNSSAIADDHLLANVVNPLLELFSECLTRTIGICFAEPGERLLVFFEKGKGVDESLELDVQKFLTGIGATSRNEVRHKYGMPPIVGGDSVIVGGTEYPIVHDEAEAEKSQNPHHDNPVNLNKRVAGVRRFADQRYRSIGQTLSPGQRAEILLRRMDMMSVGLHRSIRDYFMDRAEHVRVGIEPCFRHGSFASSTLVDEIINVHDWVAGLRKAAGPHLREMAIAGAVLEWELHGQRKSLIVNEKGLFDGLRKLPGRILDAAVNHATRLLGLDHWTGIIDTVKEEVRQAVTDSELDGQSKVDQIVNEVLGAESSSGRAERIASTESIAAISGGQHEVRVELGKAGIVRTKTWVTAGDNRVRPAHQHAEFQTVGVDDYFEVGGERALYPGDPSLSPGLRCNCRCAAVSGYQSDDLFGE